MNWWSLIVAWKLNFVSTKTVSSTFSPSVLHCESAAIANILIATAKKSILSRPSAQMKKTIKLLNGKFGKQLYTQARVLFKIQLIWCTILYGFCSVHFEYFLELEYKFLLFVKQYVWNDRCINCTVAVDSQSHRLVTGKTAAEILATD